MPWKDPEDRKAYHKEYGRKHYLANKEAYKARARANTKVYIDRIRQYVQKAKDNPCTDCGVKYPWYVMDFDHIEDKKFNIGDAVRTVPPLDRVIEEIAKCELVCANCHRIRTYERSQSSSSPTEEAADSSPV